MIVNTGKIELLNLAIASNQFKYIDIGDGGDDTSVSQTTLDRSVLTSTNTVTIDDGSYKKEVSPTRVGTFLVYEISLSASDIASNVISEIGIFNKAGIMLSRVNFKPIGPLASSETISFTFRMEMA